MSGRFLCRAMLYHAPRVCLVLLFCFMSAKPAHAGWWEDAYDYWASGEMGEAMLNSVGVSADDIAYSIDNPAQFAAAVQDEVTSGRAGTRLLGYVGTTPEKVANTIDVVTRDPCAKGPTIFDDLKSVYDDVASGRAGEAILNSIGLTGAEVAFMLDNPGVLGDALYDEWASGRAGERLLGFGEGLFKGALETVVETLYLVGDGVTYSYIVATTDTLEQAANEFKPSSQVVNLYKNSDDPGATTVMLLENLADLPGQFLSDLSNNPKAAGHTIGSFAVPIIAPRGIGALSKGAKGATGSVRASVLKMPRTRSGRVARTSPAEGLVGRTGEAVSPRATSGRPTNKPRPGDHHPPSATQSIPGEGAAGRLPEAVPATRTGVASVGDGTVSVRVTTSPRGIQVKGTVLDSYSAVKPGPLSKTKPGVHPKDSLQGTFAGGKYSSVRLSEPRVVYRVHNQGTAVRVFDPNTRTWTTTRGASETGAFWSLERPAGAGATRIDSAVLPEWGNSMTHMTAVKLPAGTVIHVGEVGAQGGYFVGGGSQLLVEGGIKTALQSGAKVVERLVLPK